MKIEGIAAFWFIYLNLVADEREERGKKRVNFVERMYCAGLRCISSYFHCKPDWDAWDAWNVGVIAWFVFCSFGHVSIFHFEKKIFFYLFHYERRHLVHNESCIANRQCPLIPTIKHVIYSFSPSAWIHIALSTHKHTQIFN